MEGVNQLFKYETKTKQIKNPKHKLCLEGNLTTQEIKFAECDDNKAFQKWKWSRLVNVAMLDDWEESGRPFEEYGSYYWND